MAAEDRIEIIFSLDTIGYPSTLWCARGNNPYTNTKTAFALTSGTLRCDYNNELQAVAALSVNTKYKVTADGNKIYLDDTLKHTFSSASFSSDLPIKLFASYWGYSINENIDNYSRLKLYSFKVSGKLHMVPVRRLSTGEVGLYDYVSSAFFANQGTGAFIAGPVKNIPDAYQEVQYLESTGTQHIDTLLCPKYTMRLIFNGYMRSSLGARDMSLSGHRASWDGDTEFNVWYNTAQGAGSPVCRAIFGGVSTATHAFQPSGAYDAYHVLDASKDGVYFDAVQIAQAVTPTYTTTSTETLPFLALKSGASVDSRKWAGVTKYAVYYLDGDLVRAFIPVYRKSDSKPGLYDLVTGAFFANQGAGADFAVGPEVL